MFQELSIFYIMMFYQSRTEALHKKKKKKKT